MALGNDCLCTGSWGASDPQQEALDHSPTEDTATGEHQAQPLKGLHVLVVDDQELNLMVARGLLESQGAQVSVLSSGQEVLPFVTTHSQAVDVILMDLQMSKMNGLQATVALRHCNDPRVSHIPVVAMTGHVMQSERTQARIAGMNGFLAKPMLLEQLIEEIERVLKPVTPA